MKSEKNPSALGGLEPTDQSTQALILPKGDVGQSLMVILARFSPISLTRSLSILQASRTPPAGLGGAAVRAFVHCVYHQRLDPDRSRGLFRVRGKPQERLPLDGK